VLPGVSLDPDDVATTVLKLITNALVKAGFGSGVDKFDCFVSYRVATDKDAARELFLQLKLSSENALMFD